MYASYTLPSCMSIYAMQNSIIRMHEFEIMLHKQVYASAYTTVIAFCKWPSVCVWGGGGGGGRGRSTRGLNPTLSTSPTIHGLLS